ncbi:MAG: MSEP-CTERM sorting domain-containing protein [Turneriella sp.]
MTKQVRLANIALIVIGALPTLIALAICARMLWVIWPEMQANQQYSALEGLLLMAAPGGAAVLCGLWALYKKRTLPRLVKLLLLAWALLCFFTFFHLPNPQPIMRSWLFDGDTYITVIIAAQLPLFYFLVYRLAAAYSIESRRSLILTGVATVAVPAILYVGFQVVRYLPQGLFFPHLAQLVFLTLNAAFSFLLLRLVLYIGRHHAEKLKRPGNFVFFQFLFVGALPFLGLILNAHGPLAHESQVVLGDFSSFTIWLLALGNAALYILPSVQNRRVSLLLFALRIAGLIFVLYFCVVFLLYLPLALVLILAFGLGFLLLIPYLALIFQWIRLHRDMGEFAGISRKTIAAVIAVGVLLLPAIIFAHIYHDRALMAETIVYVQRPPLALNQKAPVSAALALSFAKGAESSPRGFRHATGHLPIYDGLYRSIVFDGIELSENLRRRIEQAFAAKPATTPRQTTRIPATAQLDDITAQSHPKGDLTTSTVRVRFKNPGNAPAEFSGQVSLPQGVFVTGHWLMIDGVEVPAQITTKNTAIWVYDRITERQRDPSLIYYESPNTLRWRVFPVPPNGIREARLELTHAYAAALQVADRQVLLPALTPVIPAFSSTSGRSQLLAPAKAGESFTRDVYLHFVMDCSAQAPVNTSGNAKAAAEKLGLPLDHARVSYVNSSIRTENFTGSANCPQHADGFFAELAIRSILHSAYQAGGKSFPLIVILSPQKLNLAWEELSFVRQFYADADGFVQISGDTLQAFSFEGKTIAGGKPHFPLPVRNAGGRFVSAAATLVPLANGSGGKWGALDGFEQHLEFWSGNTSARARAVITAIESNTLNPAAGSIVLETEAQRRKLAELHQQMLKAVNELDAGEPVRMSEPWVYMLLIAAFAVMLKKKRK